MSWKCLSTAVVGFLAGLLAGAAGGAALADKLIGLEILTDTRTWQVALLVFAGLLTGAVGAGASLAGLGCLDRARRP